jgi:dihydroorotase
VVSLTVDLLLCNAKALLREEITDCSLAIEKGRIVKVGKESMMPKTDTKTDLQGLLLLPGLIDTHVHLRDEGKMYKEDFRSGTAAAAAGGFTTVLDMPNNEPVTMSAPALRNRMRIAERNVLVNVGFYSEFPRNLGEINGIINAGAVAFKLFMTEQVGGLNIENDQDLLEAFAILGKLKIPTAVHAEDRTEIKDAEQKLRQAGRSDVEAFLIAHAEHVETIAIRRILNIVKQTGAQVHFCHVSTESGLRLVCDAKNSTMPVTCETTPHHLLLSVDDLKRIGTQAITMPPVREKHQIEALWNGIKDHCIDTLGSDHAPHALNEKTVKSVWEVKVGIPGLETTLPLLLTEVNRGHLSMADVVRLMSLKPAEVFSLKGRGSLEEGNRADLVVVDLKRKHKIDSSAFKSKAKYSPFDGRQVQGKPVKTYVEGVLVMDEGEIVPHAGCGKIIRRE